ncbi:MAG TPA: hypothetical protein VKA34_08660 [Balneolales bacterium]|nr:hypothetical protein [Balneolales bacterium]
MKLTEKDKDFIEKLKSLVESKDLSIELIDDGLLRLVLRQNYGDRIESEFNMTRQGVRWRFHRLFNEVYLNAYLTIFWIESNFGVELREKVIQIAKQQVELRKKAQKTGFLPACRRENGSKSIK